jgi:hypothetical protein
MAATLTKIAGPTVVPGKGIEYSFSVALDTVFATGGEPIDLTSYLGYLYGGTIDGVDAIADAVWTYQVVGPGRAVATTSTNVVITAHHGAGADAVNNPADGEDLSGVGALIITVWGKGAITSSWS